MVQDFVERQSLMLPYSQNGVKLHMLLTGGSPKVELLARLVIAMVTLQDIRYSRFQGYITVRVE